MRNKVENKNSATRFATCIFRLAEALRANAVVTLAALSAVVLLSVPCLAASNEDYQAMGLDMMELNKQKRYQDLIDTYTPYAKPENLDFRFYRELGEAYFRREILLRKVKEEPDWSGADRYLSIAHRINPDDLYVIINLAILHTYTKDHRKAHYFAKMYIEKGGEERKKDAETILEKYRYFIIEERIPEPVPGTEGPMGPVRTPVP